MAFTVRPAGRADERLKARREALLKEYGEVASSFRLLSDIRFKLLGLVPLSTAVAVFAGGTLLPVQRAALGAVGLSVLLGVVTYNKRNDQLYDELVGRAAAIERELGLPDGAFANRPLDWFGVELGLFRWPVNHRFGVGLIYAASLAAWLYLLLAAAVALGECSQRHPWCSDWVAAVVAAVLTFAAVRVVSWQQAARRRQMRVSAIEAVRTAAAAGPGRLANDEQLLRHCVELVAGWPAWRAFADREARVAAVRRRAAFVDSLEQEPARRRRYWPDDADCLERAAYQVACLTDLPPRWLYDVASGRR
jgi:hypothetical protein